MNLTNKEKKQLVANAHHLKPVVILGQKGLTESVTLEVDRALTDHNLIKVKINDEKENRKIIAEQLAIELNALHLDTRGHNAIFYRAPVEDK